MEKITYTKRKKGGYYALTPAGMVIVERRYEFYMPTNDWIARFRGNVVFGTSRKEAVALVLNAVQANKEEQN